MEIIDLPHDLFLLIVAHLSARATVRCRRVSRRWRDALTDQDFCLQLMKWHYPRCREMRLSYEKRRNEGEEGEGEDDRDMDWTAVLTTVARRYHHLCTAAPRSIDKIRINGTTAEHGFLGVGTWDRFLRLEEKEAPFHYPDPSWCYSQDDGVLVYRIHPKDVVVDEQVRAYYYPWRLLDLETGTTTEIPFPHGVNERIVRRVRMNDGVLVFEWCDKMAYHQLNDREQCHRHFVTALDVVPSPPRANNNTDSWTITERAEWKLHFLGFPLNQIDRFFSAHTATHYAVYVWQPNRSPWGEDDPIESVILWDISCTPPRIVRRITWPTLAFYCVRQRSTPKLRRIALDQHNLYFVEEEHRWAQGGHSSLSPPRGHSVCSTGIPVIPFLSSLNDRPPFVDNKNSAEKGEEREEEEAIVQGPRWFDQCGADGDAKMSFCARLNFPSASSSLSSSSSSSSTSERNRSPGIWDHHYPDPGTTIQNNKSSVLAQERENAARVATTRWPGWAPCWRHEEFPYLTGVFSSPFYPSSLRPVCIN